MYEQLSSFAQTWGLLIFVLAFGLVLLYALWPGNRDRFHRAAHMPLDEDAHGSKKPDCCAQWPEASDGR